MHFTNISDGTEESATKKVDISTLTGPNGLVPSKLAIDEIRCNIQTYGGTAGGYVKVAFDATTDDTAVVLNGTDYIDFRPYGGFVDPQSTGATGDIMFTTDAFESGDSYDITIHMRKKD
jgi:hypothetical protein